MVQCFSAFLDFCYMARRNSFTPDVLETMQATLRRFHDLRQIFIDEGVREDTVSLPRQHSLVHYVPSIWLFGAPNGLCSSITESRHISAVKEPWRRSNRYEALSQMLLINKRMSKMSAARGLHTARGAMKGTTSSYTAFEQAGGVPTPLAALEDDNDDDDGGAVEDALGVGSIAMATTQGLCPHQN
jgi:hypothetical protein